MEISAAGHAGAESTSSAKASEYHITGTKTDKYKCLDMSTETRSLASSATEGDLEEARQRLLEHHCAEEELYYQTEAVNDGLQSTLGSTHRNGLPAPPLRDRNYGSVSTLQSIQPKVTPKIKRYRIPFLILIAFDFGMVIFLSIICSEVIFILLFLL